MKKLFENWREFRKSILNEQRPEARALDRIEQNPERWSSSIEDARRAARQRAYGVTTSDRPLAASQESRQEEDWDQFIAGAAASSLLALSLAAPAAAAGGATSAGAGAGQVTIPTWMGPNANFFFKTLQPHPARLHMIIKAANYIVRKFGWSYTVVFSTIFSAYTTTFTAINIDVWLGQALYGKSYVLDLIGDVIENMKNGLGYGESTMKVFSEKLRNGESPEQIASFLKEAHKMYKGLQSV